MTYLKDFIEDCSQYFDRFLAVLQTEHTAVKGRQIFSIIYARTRGLIIAERISTSKRNLDWNYKLSYYTDLDSWVSELFRQNNVRE